jgi:hypothetical protein
VSLVSRYGWTRVTILYDTNQSLQVTLIKKKIKFAPDIRKIRWEVAKSYMRKGFLIYEEMRKYLVIDEDAVSHM